jgi:hypothetical protein
MTSYPFRRARIAGLSDPYHDTDDRQTLSRPARGILGGNGQTCLNALCKPRADPNRFMLADADEVAASRCETGVARVFETTGLLLTEFNRTTKPSQNNALSLLTFRNPHRGHRAVITTLFRCRRPISVGTRFRAMWASHLHTKRGSDRCMDGRRGVGHLVVVTVI